MKSDDYRNNLKSISEDHYRTLFNSLDIGFCIIEMIFDEDDNPIDYRFIEINQAFEKETGLVNAQGRTVRELLPLHEEYWFLIYGKVAITGEPIHFENLASQIGGYYDVYAYRFGKPEQRQVAVLFHDIKRQKKAEEELRKREALYRNTLEIMMEGCAIIGYDWTYLYVNEVMAKHSHLKREEMIGRKITDLIPGVEDSSFFIAFKRCIDERSYQHIEDNFIFPDGSEGWFEVFAHPMPEGIFVLSLEITGRKKALNDLMISELKLKNALAISKMGHVEIDLVTGQITWSDEMYKIYERPVEAGPPTYEEGLTYLHPDDLDRVLNKVQNAPRNEVLEIDYRIQLPGGRIKHLAYFLTPVFEGGKQIKRIGTIQDITDRKNMELRLQQKINEKEVLLRELYHRLKNNMQIISSLLNLRAETITNEQDRDIFLKMNNHIRAMSLVHEKLYQSQNLSRINFGTYIKDLSKSLLAGYPEALRKVQIKYDLADIEVLIDTALPCGFVITELIHNAFKHAFPGDNKGSIKISLLKKDGKLEVIIADDGVGLSKAKLENSDQLGLVLAKDLVVKQLNGEMILHNTKGTSWHIVIKDVLYQENQELTHNI